MRSVRFVTWLVFGILALMAAPVSSYAMNAACCSVVSESSNKIILKCPQIGAEAQIRKEGSKNAAILRNPEAFYYNDVGTFFEANEIAVVSAKIAGGASRSVALNTFLDRSGNINWLISYNGPDGKVHATSSIGNQGVRCEEVPKVVTISASEIPQGYIPIYATTTVSPAQDVMYRLFGL